MPRLTAFIVLNLWNLLDNDIERLIERKSDFNANVQNMKNVKLT